MTEDRSSRQRSRCRIFADILFAIQESESARVTYLVHQANLPYDRLTNYLTQLEGLGLVTSNGLEGAVSFSISEKGRAYLIEFRKIKEFGDIFGVDV
jgi:predicted transcriptional regulator